MRQPEPEPQRSNLFRIRRMRPEDLPAVLEIEKVAFRHPWSAELLRRELTHDWSTIFLAEELAEDGSRRLLGFLIFWLVIQASAASTRARPWSPPMSWPRRRCAAAA